MLLPAQTPPLKHLTKTRKMPLHRGNVWSSVTTTVLPITRYSTSVKI
jgi:hypothetical protein